MKIETFWKEIQNPNSFSDTIIAKDIPSGISFIGSFIFSFFSPFPNNAFSREIEWNRVRFIRSIHHGCSPRRARNIAFVRRKVPIPAHPLAISVSQLPRASRRQHARCDRALKLVSQLACHDLDSIAHERISFPVSPLSFPSAFFAPLSSVQRINFEKPSFPARKEASTLSRIFESF